MQNINVSEKKKIKHGFNELNLYLLIAHEIDCHQSKYTHLKYIAMKLINLPLINRCIKKISICFFSLTSQNELY